MSVSQAINLSPKDWLRSRRRWLTNPQLTDLVEHALFGDVPDAPVIPQVDAELAPADPVGPLEALETDLTRLKGKLDAGRVPDEIRQLMEEGETVAEVRERLTPKLNSELSKLKNLRGLAGEDLGRESEIETLLGMLSRLGEG